MEEVCSLLQSFWFPPLLSLCKQPQSHRLAEGQPWQSWSEGPFSHNSSILRSMVWMSSQNPCLLEPLLLSCLAGKSCDKSFGMFLVSALFKSSKLSFHRLGTHGSTERSHSFRELCIYQKNICSQCVGRSSCLQDFDCHKGNKSLHCHLFLLRSRSVFTSLLPLFLFCI